MGVMNEIKIQHTKQTPSKICKLRKLTIVTVL